MAARNEVLKHVQTAYAFEECHWLLGDASNRFYGRLYLKDGSSRILMVINAPEAFKSEEVTGGESDFKNEIPFVGVGRKWHASGICVPRIEYVDSQARFLIAEDFGAEALYDRRQKENAILWYQRAIDELIKIQAIEPFVKARFTKDLLAWECHHFFEYAIEKREIALTLAENALLQNFFKKTVEKMANAPYVMVHRDYHSKNLMVLEKQNRVGVIDFQDALLGPASYDLASLLRDSYVTLRDQEEEDLLNYYQSQTRLTFDLDLFHYTSLQRNMKAVGRFFYISKVKLKDTHLAYVKPSLLRIFKTLNEVNEIELLEFLQEKMRRDVT